MGKKIIITESQYNNLLKDLIEIEPTETKIKALYESSWSRGKFLCGEPQERCQFLQ